MDHRGLSAIPFPNKPSEGLIPDAPTRHGNSILPGFLKNLKLDDIILLVVIILLLTDSNCNDKLLVGVLIFLFLTGLDLNIFKF